MLLGKSNVGSENDISLQIINNKKGKITLQKYFIFYSGTKDRTINPAPPTVEIFSETIPKRLSTLKKNKQQY